MTERTVTLVLVEPGGRVLGELAPFPVDVPWWQDVAPIVEGARARHGIDVTVLRLLTADRPEPHGGHVTYLASASGVPDGLLTPAELDLAPHPRRAPWAEPGGPEASLAWAAEVLGPVRAAQRRTWNLSAIWRLDTEAGPAWLKQVPHFFAHEAAVLDWLAGAAPGVAPVPIAAADGRLLLPDVPGTDRYGAAADERLAMLADLHAVQLTAAGRVGELLAAGVPDLRAPRLAAMVRDVAARRGGIDSLVAGLDERLAAIEACGLPDTLVHGDFHAGNVRGFPDRRTIIDWGDSVVGHPAIDALRMSEGAPDAGLLAAWSRWWRAAVPDCDPERALTLLEPVVAARNAAAYAAFLDAIEPSEWPYHAADVPRWLHECATLS
jgi:Phosphotransferase enzyme family